MLNKYLDVTSFPRDSRFVCSYPAEVDAFSGHKIPYHKSLGGFELRILLVSDFKTRKIILSLKIDFRTKSPQAFMRPSIP